MVTTEKKIISASENWLAIREDHRHASFILLGLICLGIVLLAEIVFILVYNYLDRDSNRHRQDQRNR